MLDRRSFGLKALVCSMGTMAVARQARGEYSDWLNWRGNSRDGFVGQQQWPSSLQEESLELIWQHPLDSGYSGPIVANGRVFVTETQAAKDESVTALDLSTGKVLWNAQWPGSLSVPFFAKENGDWIRSTPATNGRVLLVGGMRDVLVALDCATGEEIWRIDFPEKFGSSIPSFGLVCSPLIDEGRVYLQAGGGLVALELATGNLIWKSLDDGGGMWGSAFSSPVVANLHGQKQLLVQSRTHLNGVDLESGKELWQVKIEAFRGMNILTPVVWNDCVFTSSYGGKSLLLEFEPDSTGPWKVRTRWTHKAEAYMSSPIVIGDSLYLHLRNRRLTCIDLLSGKEHWTTTPFGRYWSMITNGQDILALDERGILLLFQHDPTEFRLRGERQVSTEQSWAHLAVAGENLLIRHLKGLNVFRWKA